MSGNVSQSVEQLLLKRSELVFLDPGGHRADQNLLRGLELELAQIGYLPTQQLRDRLATQNKNKLKHIYRTWTGTLLGHVGGDQTHTPLFRKFPDGVPDDTIALWWNKVLVHFLQGDGQACLTCGAVGTTHVLEPCEHVVCSKCFDGSNYSACPVCGHHTDTVSPFFQPTRKRAPPKEQITFKLIDLGENLDASAQALFVSFCERTQPLSPDDREAFETLLTHYGEHALAWLPEQIPLRENIALIFGKLLAHCPANQVIPQAKRHMTTATDILRLIAVYSGADASLQTQTVIKPFDNRIPQSRFWGDVAKMFDVKLPAYQNHTAFVPMQIKRFSVGKLSRSLRRELLDFLETIPYDRLVEDMLRHRSYWVWVGRFLHPHEYAKRFPTTAEAFKVLRKKSPDGTKAPKFQTWYSKVEQAITENRAPVLIDLLSQRPGEFGRRIDLALRKAANDSDRRTIASAFAALAPDLPTPMLVTLRTHLASRTKKAPVRIYWPKGKIAKGVSTKDEREVLPPDTVAPVVKAIEQALLERFAEKPHFDTAVIDHRLLNIMAPFNERTATSSAVTLPRGSRIPIDLSKTVRLFLHWCQPKDAQGATDLDLSVALYDASWKYLGVCSYYELKLKNGRSLVAQSAGDLLDAPWPDGATEFVDLHTQPTIEMGARYAVMVVNAYSGLPFSMLEHGFAGIMLRDDTQGKHFDPRSVELKFALDGENGVYMPLVLDLEQRQLHWLDVQSKGQFSMNNVATSNSDIASICPELISYFGAGVRTSLFDLGLLHAAARCQNTVVRGDVLTRYTRQTSESCEDFLSRVRRGGGEHINTIPFSQEPALGLLYRGDLILPEASEVYALFREQANTTLSAGDLLA